jgi:hypothetical protein
MNERRNTNHDWFCSLVVTQRSITGRTGVPPNAASAFQVIKNSIIQILICKQAVWNHDVPLFFFVVHLATPLHVYVSSTFFFHSSSPHHCFWGSRCEPPCAPQGQDDYGFYWSTCRCGVRGAGLGWIWAPPPPHSWKTSFLLSLRFLHSKSWHLFWRCFSSSAGEQKGSCYVFIPSQTSVALLLSNF